MARRLHCSKTTLYLVAATKEQVVVTAVEEFFRQAAGRIEARLAAVGAHNERLKAYLDAVSAELRLGSPDFHHDIVAFAPTEAIYRQNTLFAIRRVHDLISEGVDAGVFRPVKGAFVGAAAAEVMSAIQQGTVKAATGMDDAEAYEQLSDLIMTSLMPHAPRSPEVVSTIKAERGRRSV